MDNLTPTKACKTCSEKKSLEYFFRNKRRKDLLESSCKVCCNNKRKSSIKNIEAFRQKERIRSAKFYADNRDYLRQKERERHTKEERQARNLKRKDQTSRSHKLRYVIKSEEIKAKSKAYHQKNSDAINKKRKQSRVDDKDKISQTRRSYYIKISSNPIYKLKRNLRSRIHTVCNRIGLKKDSNTENILGVDIKTFRKHIERQFTKGMSWENYGEWHVDHIFPLSLAHTKEDIIRLCHYTNLQPLWALDNIKKGTKIPQVQMKIAI